MMKKKLTIYDIAKLSGYSAKTVSRVINGGENVKPATFEAISKIIEEYNYTPNIYAKNLIRKETVNILISIKKKESFPLIWFQTLLDKVLVTCKEMGVNAIVEYFDEEDKISDSILSASGSLVDGVVVFYEAKEDARIEYLRHNNIPFIIFGRSTRSDVIYVSNDDYQSLYDLMETLVKMAHKKIWMLMGGHTNVNLDRVQGATDYLVDNNLTDRIELNVFYDLLTIESVYHFAMEHLTKDNLPNAIFVSGDEKVQGLIRACYDKGISIPTDVAVVGFDNIPISQFYTPALSTISPSYSELSIQLVDRLLKIIEGEKTESLEVGTEFINRQTT